MPVSNKNVCFPMYYVLLLIGLMLFLTVVAVLDGAAAEKKAKALAAKPQERDRF